MTKIFITALIGLSVLLGSLPGFCDEGAGTVLWQDKETGQLYTKPAEGRVAVDAVKDLKMPESALSGLYEDENGTVYTKPGSGRKPIAAAAQPVATPQASEAGEGADYSTQAFSDAVKHVVSEEQATSFPKIKMGTLMYGEYFYDFDKRNTTLENGHHDPRNKFTLNRLYINLRADLTPEINFRATPDITRDALGDWKLRLKFGYVEFHDFLDFYPSLDVKLGQYETCWLDYEEGLWQYRVLDTMLIEKEGFFNSADLGVGFKGKIPAGYGEWAVDVINGEGYHADEANKYKTAQARLTINPVPQVDILKGLQVSGFVSTGNQDFHTKRDRYIAFLSYKYHDDLFLAGEYDRTFGADSFVKAANNNLNPGNGVPAGRHDIKGAGFSALAWYRMPFLKPLRVLGRYDLFRHDLDQADTTVHRWYAGLSYDINKYVMLAVVNERTIDDANLTRSAAYPGGHGTAAGNNENLLKVDVQVKFN